MRFGKKLAFVLSSKLFWIEALSLSLIVALLPYASPLSEFCYAFLKDLHLGFLQENLLIALCIVPIFFALTVFAKLSTLNWWQRLIRKKILKKDKRTFLRMVLQLLYTSIAYIAAAFVLPIVIVMVCSLAIVANYVLIGFFGAVICVTLLILIVRYGADLRARRKLMNQLKKICNTSKYKITDVKNVYLTVFFQREGSNFTIETENVSFCCKFVRCPSRKKAIYFRDCGEAYYNSDFLNVIKHSISCEYFFETKDRLSRETKKIIVVTPEAARLLATDDATDRLIYSGDAVMGYKVYQSSAFIGAVERRCL